ncbi:MAG: Omp28-related outer membrane protein [Bacteroidia bacterium]|nr:Omp28-related outer membrane protein [Bacteroidia bacterium]
MKKLFLYAVATGFLFTACQKEDTADPSGSSGMKAASAPNVSPVPATFVKKVMVEEFTSATNGFVPESSRDLYSSVKANPGRVYLAGLHLNDIMAHNQTNRLMSAFTPGNASIPCATVDRANFAGNTYLSSNQYSNAISASLLKPVTCGVAINSAITGNSAVIDIHAGFAATMPGSYKISAYLIEDRVVSGNPLFYQANAFNNMSGSPFYNAGNPITGFVHNNVVRRVLSSSMGDPINITAQVAGGSAVFNYKIDMPQKHNPNSTWKVIAFITNDVTNEIVNVQMGDLGSLQDWN